LKRVCFIVSHLGSGSSDLVDVMNANPRCQIASSGATYSSPENLEWLFRQGHKCRDSSAVYGDHLLYNVSFSCKNLYETCRFIYVIRPARASLNEMLKARDGRRQSGFADYYRFRLRRICEMAHNTPDALFLAWDDLAKGTAFPTIEEYLGLKVKLKPEYRHFTACVNDSFDESLISEAQDAYERYYYYLNGLGLRRVS